MEHPVKTGAIVIGGLNMDIGGSPSVKLVMRDSNPGKVTATPGGVGRNIAHNLRLLGLEVSLIAAVGGDLYAKGLLDSCSQLGIDMSMALVLPGQRSSTYLYVNDSDGDMLMSVSDMEICKEINPAYLQPLMERINKAAAVVLDANLTEETIRYICDNCTAPLYADPVSTAKAGRLKPVLGKLRAIKPNAMEAQTLTGLADPEEAAQAMLQAGVQRVFISMSKDGMIAAQEGRLLHLPPAPAKVINTTGAGDAATAALVYAGIMGMDLESSAKAALKAGAVTTQCVQANNPALAQLFQDDIQ